MVTRKTQNGSEYIRLWRPSGVEGIGLHSSRLFSLRQAKHFHEEYTIGINDGGVGSFWCRGANLIAGRRSLTIMARGEVHTGAAASSEGWTFRGVYIAPSWVEEIARQLDWRSGVRLFFRQSNVIDDAAWFTMDRVFRTLSSPHSRLEAETTLLTSLRLVFERFGDPRAPASRIAEGGKHIAKVREYVTNRYSDDISLNKLAAVGGLSPYYLIHCFRKAFGLPPHAYQLQVRLQRAKADLKSDASLAQIAIKHGFCDQSHFHRHFKRTFGITPGQYRHGNFVQDD